MLIEQPTSLLSWIYPKAVFRKDPSDHSVFLTFDDGPVPEITPWVLDQLDEFQIKATFFVVGDNVRKHPDIFKTVLDRGHKVGNHTFNHVRGLQMRNTDYVANVEKCDRFFTTKLFRPPHGVMRHWEYRYMLNKYEIIFWDVVTRDYSIRVNGEQVLNIVKKYTRNGSIIVFHDSQRAEIRLRYALPKALEWLKNEGYEFKLL